jgi:uncharacterized protein involved in exopolysaccharide biosynthesis
MEPSRGIAENAGGEIDLWQLVHSLWEGKWLIVLTTAAFSIAAVAFALLATETYRAEALVQPRQESRDAGGLGLLASQFGGLADLAGLSLGGGGDRSVAIATLKSRTVIEAFIQEKNLLPKLFEARWDADAGKWKRSDPKYIPTVWRGYIAFSKDILKVTDDKKTGLLTVAIEWRNPEEAQQWVTELIARTNEYLKAQAIREGEKNLAYLEEQSRKIGQVELQKSLYSLVERELKKLMIAKGDEEFAIKTIDRAVVPKEHARPKRALIAILGFLLGGIVGVIAVLVRMSWRARSELSIPRPS